MSKILLIDNSDFISHPKGGTLAFDIQLIKVLPHEKVALVGISTTSELPVGKWSTIIINGLHYDYFAISKYKESSKKPLIPLRVKTLICLLFYLHRIRKKKYRHVFTQTPQFLFALKYFKWKSICFCFAGVGNSISLSRYRFLRMLGGIYEKRLFKLLKIKVDTVLAAADSTAIADLVKRSKGVLEDVKIHPFPTRFDEKIFRPLDKTAVRNSLNIDTEKIILVTVGKLSWVKGWDLLIALMKVNAKNNFVLIFVGDGEDRRLIEDMAKDLISEKKVLLTGNLPPENVARYINCADVVLVASYVEGWSTAMVESIGCGKPIVSTKVSGASSIIKEGKNGYILEDRNVATLSKLIEKTLCLPNYSEVSLDIAKEYSLSTLYNDFRKAWPQSKDIL